MPQQIAGPTPGPSLVFDIGDHKQLFLDEALIAAHEGVQLRMHSPHRTGAVLIASDQPWESGPGACIGAYCSVLQEQGRIRLWYDSLSDAYRRVSYAESEDGLHFIKPHLGLYEIAGSRANNVVLPGPIGSSSVWIDPHAAPEHRFKTLGCTEQPAPYEFHLHASPDGLRWTLLAKPQIGDMDTQNVAFWDERYGRYVMYTRLWVRRERHLSYRVVRRLESDDLIHWDQESVVWAADEADLATHVTPEGQPPVDYYGACVCKYPEAGDLYIMLAEAFWHWQPRAPRPGAPSRGGAGAPAEPERLAPSAMDVRLGVSRDGKSFRHVGDRGPFLSLGPDGAFDSRLVWAMPNPIVRGDELWFYYSGGNRDHDDRIDPAAPGLLSGIGRAVLRMDGLVSAEAGPAGGQILTQPLRFAGRRLELNVDTGAWGSIRVELLDAEGHPLPGLAGDAASPLIANAVHTPVVWGEKAAVGDLAGRPIRIRFTLQNCRLYAFRFVA